MPVSYVADYQIPLPPLDVQRQIVAELDSYRKVIEGARLVIANYKPTIKIDPSWPRVKLGDVCKIEATLVDPKQPEYACFRDFRLASFGDRDAVFGI